MRSFAVSDMTPSHFVERIRLALAEEDLAGIVSVSVEGETIVARLRRLGNTELRFQLEQRGQGFSAHLVGERVAPLHRPYRRRFEQTLESLLARLGGEVS